MDAPADQHPIKKEEVIITTIVEVSNLSNPKRIFTKAKSLKEKHKMDWFLLIGAAVLAIALPAFVIWLVMRTPINLRARYTISVSALLAIIEVYLIILAVTSICAKCGLA